MTGARGLASRLPYIIASRINETLITNLQLDNYPILLEGLHCTGILTRLDLANRKVVVRIHNEESTYYRELARVESSWLKKLYFLRESRLIRKYSHHLPEQCIYACISQEDTKILQADYHLAQTRHLPAFPSWQQVNGEEGM